MNEIIQHVLHDITIQQALLIILNLILIESLLSVDNAAVLATMVMDLPKEQRKRALKYGIVGAYIFRGICLVLAAWLIKIWWLKAVGGLYLLYLFIDYFYTKSTPKTEDDLLNKKESKFYKYTLGLLGSFWSIIGILAMRFVAQSFVRLMEKYPFLEKAAFIVIGILGVKLLLSIPAHYSHNMPIFKYIESEHFDMIVSIITVLVFFVPVITSLLFNYPKRHEIKEEEE